MSRRELPIEVNQKFGGIITEAGPLNFPADASVDERNFMLNRDGSRTRRKGIDLEPDHVEHSIPLTPGEDISEVFFSNHLWDTVDEYNAPYILVVQSGRKFSFFNVDSVPLSDGLLYEFTDNKADPRRAATYANINNKLVIANGRSHVAVYTFSEGGITREEVRLKIRDLFGVEDIFSPENIDMRSGANISFRPEIELSNAHIYNLRNQTWAPPMRKGEDEIKDDPIFWFNWATGFKKFPSNADNMLSSVAPLTDDNDDRIGDRFHPEAAVKEDPGSMPAPRGHFIIDALERSQSRLEEYAKYVRRYDGEGSAAPTIIDQEIVAGAGSNNPIRYIVTDLPEDRTIGGPSVVANFYGRFFYSGFDGKVVGGDKHSPRLGSYVLFSQLINDPSNISSCYQEGDPTSKSTPDLLDTDGGFIEISGAKNIKRLIPMDEFLLVFAENGVWAIMGGSDYGFSATNYRVDKVSSSGCLGPYTVVQSDHGVAYWAEDGIWMLGKSESGALSPQNLTENTIQSFYSSISNLSAEKCQGVYEPAARRIRWLYEGQDDTTQQLLLDLTNGSFYPLEIRQPVVDTLEALFVTGNSIDVISYDREEGFTEVFDRPPSSYANLDMSLISKQKDVVLGFNGTTVECFAWSFSSGFGDLIQEFSVPNYLVSSGVFTPDGDKIILGLNDANFNVRYSYIGLFEWTSNGIGNELDRVELQDIIGRVFSIAINPQGSAVAVINTENTAISAKNLDIWRFSNEGFGEKYERTWGQSRSADSYTAVEFNPTGDLLAACTGYIFSLMQFNPDWGIGKTFRQSPSSGIFARDLAFTRNGRALFVSLRASNYHRGYEIDWEQGLIRPYSPINSSDLDADNAINSVAVSQWDDAIAWGLQSRLYFDEWVKPFSLEDFDASTVYGDPITSIPQDFQDRVAGNRLDHLRFWNSGPEFQLLPDPYVIPDKGTDYILSASKDCTGKLTNSSGEVSWNNPRNYNDCLQLVPYIDNGQERFYMLDKSDPNPNNDLTIVHRLGSNGEHIQQVNIGTISSPVTCLDATSDGLFIYAGRLLGELSKTNRFGTVMWSTPQHTARVNSVSTGSFQNQVYVGYADGIVKKFDQNGVELWTFSGHTDAINQVRQAASNSVVTASDDQTVRRIDFNGNESWVYTGHTDSVLGVWAIFNDIISVSKDNTCKKLDFLTGAEEWSFEGPSGSHFTSVSGYEGGPYYVGSSDGTLTKLDGNGNQLWSVKHHSDSVNFLYPSIV